MYVCHTNAPLDSFKNTFAHRSPILWNALAEYRKRNWSNISLFQENIEIVNKLLLLLIIVIFLSSLIITCMFCVGPYMHTIEFTDLFRNHPDL